VNEVNALHKHIIHYTAGFYITITNFLIYIHEEHLPNIFNDLMNKTILQKCTMRVLHLSPSANTINNRPIARPILRLYNHKFLYSYSYLKHGGLWNQLAYVCTISNYI